MPLQDYQANAIFGTNTTGPIIVTANTIQEAAEIAVRALDQNTLVRLANGDFRNGAVRNSGVVGTIASNSRTAFVLVRDPSLSPFQVPFSTANAFNVTVTHTAWTDANRPITQRDASVALAANVQTTQTFG